MSKKHEKYKELWLSVSEMANALDSDRRNFDVMRRKSDFPAMNSSRKYDLVAVCKWIITHTEKQSVMMPRAAKWLKANAWDGAEEADNSADEKPVEDEKVPASVPVPPFSTPNVASVPTTAETGAVFSDQLNMFRQAVSDCALAYNVAVKAGDPAQMGFLLKNWGAAFEQLRKAEESIIEIEKARGALIPAEEAKAAFCALCGNIRTNLMLLPAKLAHELLNQSSPKDIQTILEDEVRNILENLARNPFED